MSITKFREMFERKGCQVFLMILGIALGLGFVALGPVSPLAGLFGKGNGAADAKSGPPVATVGKISIYADTFQDAIDAQLKQLGQDQRFTSEVAADPAMKAMIYQQGIGQAVAMAAVASVADDLGIKLDDTQILDRWKQIADDDKKQKVQQLTMMGKLKPGATQADIDKAIADAIPDYAQQVSTKLDEVKADLANPARSLTARAPAMQKAVEESLGKTVTVTEDQVKADFDDFGFDVVSLSDPKLSQIEAKANGQKASDELKAGKTFEEVQTAFNVKGQPLTLNLKRSEIEADEAMKSLLTMKPGETTGVIDHLGQVQILRFKAMSNKLPPDYDKNKDTLLKQKKDQLVRKKAEDLLKAKMDKSVVWSSKGLEFFYNFVLLNQNPETNKPSPARTAALAKLYESSKTIQDTMVLGQQVLAFGQVAVTSDLYASATGADKVKWAKAKLDATMAALAYTDSPRSRLEAAKLADEIGDKDATYDQFVRSIKSNVSFTGLGLTLYQDQLTFLDAEKKKNAFTEPQLVAIQKELDQWNSDKAAFEKDQAQLAKDKADAEKANKDEQERLKAAEQKAIDAEKAKTGAAPNASAGAPAGAASKPADAKPTESKSAEPPKIGFGK